VPKRKRKAWTEYPLRQCRFMNECAICNETIHMGHFYYDGGYGRRAHEVCVHPIGIRTGTTPAQREAPK